MRLQTGLLLGLLLLSRAAYGQEAVCYACNDAALTLDGRYLIFMPGCKPEVAFDLRTGNKTVQGIEMLMIERGVYPLRPLERTDVDPALYHALTRKQPGGGGYYAYKLPGTRWIARISVRTNCSPGQDGSAYYAGGFEVKSAVRWLAKLYVQQGIRYLKRKKFDEGMISFQKAIVVDPVYSRGHYNLACAFALQGKATPAINFLAIAIHLSSHYAPYARRDRDFRALRQDPRFMKLVLTVGPRSAPYESVVISPLASQIVIPDLSGVFRKVKRHHYHYDPRKFKALVPNAAAMMSHGRFLLTIDLSRNGASWESQKSMRSGLWMAIGMWWRGFRLLRTTNLVSGSVFEQLYDALSKGKPVSVIWYRTRWRNITTVLLPVTTPPRTTVNIKTLPTPQPKTLKAP